MSCTNNKKVIDLAQFLNYASAKTISIETPNLNHIIPEKVIEDISFIKLQTTRECFISHIHQIEFYKELIYILDGFNIIYIFKLNGEYVNKIKHIGKGPGEYTKISKFRIQNDTIVIGDTKICKIINYSLEGDFLEEHRLDFNFRDFGTTNRFYCLYDDNRNDKRGYKSKLLYFDKKNYELNRAFFNYDKHQEYRTNNFYKYNDKLRFTHGMDPYIYEVEDSLLIPVYKIDFGKYNYNKDIPFVCDMFDDEQYGKSNICTFPDNFVENEQYLFFKYLRGFFLSFVYYDKAKNICYSLSRCVLRDRNILSLVAMKSPKSTYGNKFVGVLSADEILNKDLPRNEFSSIDLEGKFKQLRTQVNQNDNPVLVLYSINVNQNWY